MTPASARQNTPVPSPPLHPRRDMTQPPPWDPPTAPPRLELPVPSRSSVLLILCGAFMANLALQGRVASVAGWCSVVLAGAVILANPIRRTTTAFVTVTLAVTVGTNLVLRASDWVIGPTIAACLALLLLASLDQLAEIGLANASGHVLTVLQSSVRSIAYFLSPIRRWLGPKNAERATMLRGLAVGAGVTSLLTLLLANADAVIGELLTGSLSSSIWVHLVLTGLCALAFGTASLLSHQAVGEVEERRALAPRPVEALMGLGSMALVLTGWVVVQLTIALGGADRLLTTAGLTRAQHAREGFFELVTVVAVVLSLLAIFSTFLGRPARSRTTPARFLVLAVGLLAVILVAVTFTRLAMYIDAFGLTMLRLSVAWFLGWLTFLVVAVTASSSGVGEERTWLTTTVIVSAAVVVVLFGWSNPAATVAATNLERGSSLVDLDADYLSRLGPDAASVLDASGIPTSTACPGEEIHPFGPFGWNRSWAEAC